MESFYYVLLFASIHWMPHDDLKNIKKLILDFFDEIESFRGGVRGGCMKIANIGSNRYHSMWGFTNTSLRSCLEDIGKLQDEWTKNQPDWKPQNLYAILESTDNEALPLGDRVDHIQKLRDGRDHRRALAELRNANLKPSASKSTSESESLKTPSNDTQTSDLNNNKRSAEDAGLDECIEPVKRQNCPMSVSGDHYQLQDQDSQCS